MTPGRRAALVATVLLASPWAAGAQDPPPASPPPEAAVSAESESIDGFRWRKLELRGRLLVRGWTDREDGESASDFEAENARLELRWRPARWLRGVVE